MSEEKRTRFTKIGLVASGCLLTSLIWFVAVSMIFGTLAGDCFPQLGRHCPSDHARNVRVIVIALAAASINALGLFCLARVFARTKSDAES